jgi:acyl-CoA thioester hydrolase
MVKRLVMEATALDQPYRGGFVPAKSGASEHHFALSVYFEDTDAAGIVYYANYLKFMERARSDMIRAAGVDQFAEHRASGSAYAVVAVAIRYKSPGRLGDDLRVISTVSQVRASSVDIQQRVMRGTEMLTDATVTAAFLDKDSRPRRQPREWVNKFNALLIHRQ